jgi:hypothetical protein
VTTPLTVHLPFNRDILGRTFTPAKRGAKPPVERGHWVLVQDQSLLVVSEVGGFRLPHGECPVPLETAPFWLGTYRDTPCWVVAVPPQAPPPEGLAAETLVPMRNTRLPDDLL